jgi:hypothetical protein
VLFVGSQCGYIHCNECSRAQQKVDPPKAKDDASGLSLASNLVTPKATEAPFIVYLTHALVLFPPGCFLGGGAVESGAAVRVAAAVALDAAVDLPRFFTGGSVAFLFLQTCTSVLLSSSCS